MAIVFDEQGNLVDTEGRINFAPEGSDVLPPNPFLSPDTADSPYANLIGVPATQDMGYLYGVPQRADDQGYLTGLPGTAAAGRARLLCCSERRPATWSDRSLRYA